MQNSVTIVAGSTGNLGGRIIRALLDRGAETRALVRRGSSPERVESLRRRGAMIVEVDFENAAELKAACMGGSCVVSALSGLHEVIVERQTQLLTAAMAAGVGRFIPSDFSFDFARLRPGNNRNLDLRREFHERLDSAPIAATSILSGMFADLLTGQAPLVLFRLRRVVYWENADQPLDFTTVDDTAAFTAAAARDPSAPRVLRIAGDSISASGLAAAASEVTGTTFRLFRAGSLTRLEKLIAIARTLVPQPRAVFPAWQGMQYLRDMFSGCAKLTPLDNDRYPGMPWTTMRDVLATHELNRQG
jgi:nucleoside-diphosphate-sugar epimerase